MKTLHLVLKGCWYDKIASGEKTSEYRECKPYWNKRFAYNPTKMAMLNHCTKALLDVKTDYTQVVFHRGYTSETMEFEIKYISFLYKLPNDLNAPMCYEIKLGRRIC